MPASRLPPDRGPRLGARGCVSPVAGPERQLRPRRSATRRSPPIPRPIPAPWSAWANTPAPTTATSPRIAVGRIADYTGKEESDGSGRKLTQGASLMAMSALAKAGADLVERYDTSVSELELKYANNKLITDGAATPGRTRATDYRKIMAGQVRGLRLLPGRRHHRAELQHPLLRRRRAAAPSPGPNGVERHRPALCDERRPRPAPGRHPHAGGGRRDLLPEADHRPPGRRRLVQIVWRQRASTSRAGESGLEPIQLAVRSVIERAVLEMMANLYGAPGPRSAWSPPRPPGHRPASPAASPGPYARPSAANDAATRQDPSRWDVNRDSDVQRGRW